MNMMEFGLNRQRNAFEQCMRCGKPHIFGKCRAYNATCNKCHRMGHFARVCRSSKSTFQNQVEQSSGTCRECPNLFGRRQRSAISPSTMKIPVVLRTMHSIP